MGRGDRGGVAGMMGGRGAREGCEGEFCGLRLVSLRVEGDVRMFSGFFRRRDGNR